MRHNIASLSLLVFAFALALLQGCSPDAQHPRGWVPLDLLPHGVPTIILAPPDAVVKAGSIQSSMVKDITITGGKDYSVQLFYSPTLTNDILRLFHELNEEGATILVVTHEMDVAESGKRIIEMRDGRIISDRKALGRVPEVAE